MKNNLDRNFSFGQLMRFAVPTILNLFLISATVMVDSLFIANVVGEVALASVNLVMPFTSLMHAVAFVLSIGGSAIIGHNMGQGRYGTARQRFTLLVLVSLAVGVLGALVGLVSIEGMLDFLGANDATRGHMRDYVVPFLYFAPSFIAQLFFYFLLITAGKPGFNLVVTLVSTVSNIVLDYLFIVVLGLGTLGAALGTGLAATFAAALAASYFAFNKAGTLRFVRPRWEGRVLRRAAINGSSEAVHGLAGAIITWSFNMIMARLAGNTGVAAITIIQFLQFLLLAALLGFTSGVAPIFSFNHGAGNGGRQRRLMRQTVAVCAGFTGVSFIAAQVFPAALVGVFVRPDSPAFSMAVTGLRIYSLALLMVWVPILFSELFTALGNGPLSALISFARSFGFLLVFLLVLPPLMGVAGVWWAIPLAEFCALSLTAVLVVRTRERYGLF